MTKNDKPLNTNNVYPSFGKQDDIKTVKKFLYHIFIIRFLDKYALRSFIQVLVHICIAIAIAILLYYLFLSLYDIDGNNFVAIMSSIAAASGALLAVTIAFGTFRSQHFTDWTYRSRERLRRQQEKLELQMKMSADKNYPDISHHLQGLYMLSAQYIPGQPIEMDKVEQADKIFHKWAGDYVQSSGKTFDFGNINDYESYEKHLYDAHLLSTEWRDIMTELHVADRTGRSLETLPPLITTWATILIYALVFAISVSTGIMCDNLNISFLVIPVYLSLFAVAALVIDFRAMIINTRGREIGYEMAITAFIQKQDENPK